MAGRLALVDTPGLERRCAREGCEESIIDARVGPRRKFCTDECRIANASQRRSARRALRRRQADAGVEPVAGGVPDRAHASDLTSVLGQVATDSRYAAAQVAATSETLERATALWTVPSPEPSRTQQMSAERLFDEARRRKARALTVVKRLLDDDLDADDRRPTLLRLQTTVREAFEISADLADLLRVDVQERAIRITHPDEDTDED